MSITNHQPFTYPAAVANAIMGTWELPLPGLKLPDVQQDGFTRWLHKLSLAGGDKNLRAYMRAAIMEFAIRGIRVKSGTFSERPGLSHPGGFWNSDDQEVFADPALRSLFFPGSGIDSQRNHAVGIRDLALYEKTLTGNDAIKVSALAYLYNAYPGAWFERIKDAYILNAKPDYFSQEAQQFVESRLLGKVCAARENTRNDETGRLNCSGKKTAAELAENLHFVWAGQSYGGTFCYMVINALNAYMKDIGYGDDEIDAGYGKSIIFSPSGALPITESPLRPSPRIIAIEHIYDFVGFQSNRHGIHPFLNGPALGQDVPVTVSRGREMHWLDFNLSDPPLPDSYGYHDPRETLPRTPATVLETLRSALKTPDNG